MVDDWDSPIDYSTPAINSNAFLPFDAGDDSFAAAYDIFQLPTTSGTPEMEVLGSLMQDSNITPFTRQKDQLNETPLQAPVEVASITMAAPSMGLETQPSGTVQTGAGASSEPSLQLLDRCVLGFVRSPIPLSATNTNPSLQ